MNFATTADPTYRHASSNSGSLETPTHPIAIGYLFWVFGFTGAHRFYFGKPITGAIWFFTGGLLLIGWVIDIFFIPAMAQEANGRYRPAQVDYPVAWLLTIFLGVFGAHRFYMGKIITGVIYLLTGGLMGIGWIYDICTLNEQIETL
ncbi:MAG: TM2 domain-containing protein [Planctomycetota bacterium]